MERGTLAVAYNEAEVSYDFSELDELLPAYAISVHRSQGSEFPAVVVPVLPQHYPMLQQNLLYTAVSRARKLAVLVGSPRAIAMAVKNQGAVERYTSLGRRLGSQEDANVYHQLGPPAGRPGVELGRAPVTLPRDTREDRAD